jgi:hypothetical protein
MKYLQNSVGLGILAFVLTYAYYWYCKSLNVETIKRKLQLAYEQGIINQTKVHELMMLAENESIGLMYPIIVGLIVWGLSCAYFSSSKLHSREGGTSSDLLTRISEDITMAAPPTANNYLWR